jgi:hypothetical protein
LVDITGLATHAAPALIPPSPRQQHAERRRLLRAAGRPPDRRFPISGFARPADWAGSAIVDFTYLELALGRNLDPREAAAHTKRLIRFADDTEKSPIAGSGFTIYAP